MSNIADVHHMFDDEPEKSSIDELEKSSIDKLEGLTIDFEKESRKTQTRIRKLIEEMGETRATLKKDIEALNGVDNKKVIFARRALMESYGIAIKTELDAESKLFEITQKRMKTLEANFDKIEASNIHSKSDDNFDPSKHVRSISKAVNEMIAQDDE